MKKATVLEVKINLEKSQIIYLQVISLSTSADSVISSKSSSVRKSIDFF